MKSSHHNAPIGIFDSGIGGLSVMQAIKKALPYEQLIYFGDTARVPYGGKSSQTIIRYSVENTNFLLSHQIKLLVVACNTSNAYAMPALHALTSSLPIVGVIESGIEKAINVTRHQRIGIIGTKATIQSGIYQSQLKAELPQGFIATIACPLFVPLVEEGFADHPATRLIIHDYLKPLKNQQIDTLILGCTHYPFLTRLIQEEMGSDVKLVDSASTCAEKIKQLLEEQQLGAEARETECRYYVSDDPERFSLHAESLLGHPLDTSAQCI